MARVLSPCTWKHDGGALKLCPVQHLSAFKCIKANTSWQPAAALLIYCCQSDRWCSQAFVTCLQARHTTYFRSSIPTGAVSGLSACADPPVHLLNVKFRCPRLLQCICLVRDCGGAVHDRCDPLHPINTHRDTGKGSNRTAVFSAMNAYLSKALPEMVDPIYNTPAGTDALGSPAQATLSALATLFVESPAYLVTGSPANLALYRRRLLLDPNMTLVDWGNRAQV